MSSAPADVSIRPLDAATMQTQRDALLDVYHDAYADKIDLPFFTAERHWERLEGYAKSDSFGMVVAERDGQALGYSLGYTLPIASRWWSGLLTPVDPDLLTETGHRTFALNYIMVRQPWRRHGVARALHDALMASRTEERATLLVLPDNTAAQTAYASWGWYKLGTLQPFDDAPIYDALVLSL